MDSANPAELRVLGWIFTSALVLVVAAIVVLIRSGRTVSLPMIQWPSRLRHDDRAPLADHEARPEREADRERSVPRGPHAHGPLPL